MLIVNWNAGALARTVSRVADAQSRPPDRIVIVDNTSTDDSLELAAPHLRGVEVIRLPDERRLRPREQHRGTGRAAMSTRWRS